MTLSRKILPVRLKVEREVARRRGVEAQFAAERTQHFAELESLILAREGARSAVLWEVPDDDIRLRQEESDRAARRAEQLEAMVSLAETRRAAAPRPAVSTPRRSLGWRPSLAAHSLRTARAVDPSP